MGSSKPHAGPSTTPPQEHPQPQQHHRPSLEELKLNPDEFPRHTLTTLLQRYPLPLVVGPATNQDLEEWVIDIDVVDWLGPRMPVLHDNPDSKELVFDMKPKRLPRRFHPTAVVSKEARVTRNLPELNLPESMASIAATVLANESDEPSRSRARSQSTPINNPDAPNDAGANFRGRDVPYHLSAFADVWFTSLGDQTTMSIFVPKPKECREEQKLDIIPYAPFSNFSGNWNLKIEDDEPRPPLAPTIGYSPWDRNPYRPFRPFPKAFVHRRRCEDYCMEDPEEETPPTATYMEVPPWYGHDIWLLDSAELYQLATKHSCHVSYVYNLPGIFQAMYFLQQLPAVPHPLPNLDTLAVDGILHAEASPMLDINRLFKGLWEFLKSIRLFLRTAILDRHQYPNDPYRHEFWVQCPLVSISVYRILSQLMQEFFNIETYAIDHDGQHPPRRDIQKFGFYANLLGTGVRAKDYESPMDMVTELYMFMFRAEDHVEILIWWEKEWLIDPLAVSYAFPTKAPYDRIAWDAPSPPLDAGNICIGDILEGGGNWVDEPRGIIPIRGPLLRGD